jgi:hypothetical protein
MHFEKVGTLRIPDPKETFYDLKNKGAECGSCSSKLTYAAKDSALRAACRKCKQTVMEVPFKRVRTYEQALEEAKTRYEASTVKVLQAKFDHLFNYTANADIEKEKAAYIRNKQEYHELLQSYKLITRFPSLDPKLYDAARFQKESVMLPLTEGSKVRFKTVSELEDKVWGLKYKVLDPRAPLSHILPFTVRDLELPK